MAVSFPAVDSPAESKGLHVAEALADTPQGTSLGRLGAMGAWMAAVQGRDVPVPFANPRAIVVAGHHGIAQRGISAWKPEDGAAQAAEVAAGGGPVNAAARLAGASVRLIDNYLSTPTGCIDVEAAMTPEALAEAIAHGTATADREIDGGADLIIPGDIGPGNSTIAATVYATFTVTEPVLAIGRGSGIDDNTWKTKVTVIRDAMFRTRNFRSDTERVLAELSGPDFAFLVGLIAQSAVRKTPVLIDGVYVAVAAYAAERLAPGTKRWLLASQLSAEPAHAGCMQALELTPVLALDMATGQGTGALAALPQLNLAAELVSEALGLE